MLPIGPAFIKLARANDVLERSLPRCYDATLMSIWARINPPSAREEKRGCPRASSSGRHSKTAVWVWDLLAHSSY